MKRAADNADDLRPEYGPEFFKDLKPNRFADRAKLGRAGTPARSTKLVSARAAGKKSSKKC